MIYNYDGIGKKCPVPLIQLRLLLKQMQLGDQCTITIDDGGSIKDIPKLLNKQGYCYIERVLAHGIVEIRVKACTSCETKIKNR